MKTALQQFIEWGDKMMLEHPLKVLSFAEAIDKAAELLIVEREQIEDAYGDGLFDGSMDDVNDRMHKQYYNETFGGNNE
jgi:predicted hotdog family 3-hydroxylacyl-ACP dehydratase